MKFRLLWSRKQHTKTEQQSGQTQAAAKMKASAHPVYERIAWGRALADAEDNARRLRRGQ